MSNLSHIYVAFANDSRASLQLEKEKKGLEDYFLPLESKSILNLVLRDPVDLAKLSSDFINFEHKIELLHFSGHASTQKLYFELLGGNTQEANALGLTSLLARQRGLKLLVLNACSSLQQAELVQEAFRKAYPELPSPTVIGTRRPVNDEAACLFSQHFYLSFTQGRTVKEAFEHAESMVKAYFGNASGGFRDLYFEGGEEGDTSFPWVLLPGGRSGWALPIQEASKTLGEKHQYLCNREVQETAFQNAYYKPETIDFYILQGPERQRHGSLPKRFRHEFMEGEKAAVLPISFNEANAIEDGKSAILISLFQKLEGEKPKCRVQDLNFARLLKSAQSFGYREVLVNIEIDSSKWKPFFPELLRWFAEQFCQTVENASPRFLFFLSIVYVQLEAPKPTGFLGKLFSKTKDPNEELEKALEQLPFTRLDKLMPVKSRDIEKWVELCGISEYKTQQEKIRQLYFEPKELYDMEEVELTLAKIINDFNQKKPKLMELLA